MWNVTKSFIGLSVYTEAYTNGIVYNLAFSLTILKFITEVAGKNFKH